jgi:hypothetical protein
MRTIVFVSQTVALYEMEVHAVDLIRARGYGGFECSSVSEVEDCVALLGNELEIGEFSDLSNRFL